STQPSGSSTKVHPTFGFPDKSPSNLWVPARKCRQPFRLHERLRKKPSSKSQESVTQGHLSIDYSLPPGAEINGRVQLMVPPSEFGMDTTARRKEHYQDEHAERPQPKVTVQCRDEARSYQYNIKASRSNKDRHEDRNESPLRLLQAQEAQARPAESSMKTLGFGLRVLLDVLISEILSLANILPLRIYGYRSSTSIWGMSRSITLYTDVPGFSIKLSANSD
ncbi:hypothetical protein HID58_074675, partial [Brassica napus]